MPMPISNSIQSENSLIYDEINQIYKTIVDQPQLNTKDKDDQLYRLQTIIDKYNTSDLPKTNEQLEQVHKIVKYCYENQKNRYNQDSAFKLLVKIAEKIPVISNFDPITYDDYIPGATVIVSSRQKYNLVSLLTMFQSNITNNPITQKPFTDHEFQRICQEITKAINDGRIKGKNNSLETCLAYLVYWQPRIGNISLCYLTTVFAICYLFLLCKKNDLFYRHYQELLHNFSLDTLTTITADLLIITSIFGTLRTMYNFNRYLLLNTTPHTMHQLPYHLKYFEIAENQEELIKHNHNVFFSESEEQRPENMDEENTISEARGL